MITKRQRTIPAKRFKAECAKLLDEVAATGEEIVITKRGRPVAKLAPPDDDRPSLFGSMRGSVTILGDIVSPMDVAWEALGDDDGKENV